MKINKKGKLIFITITLILIITLIISIKIKVDNIYTDIIQKVNNFDSSPIDNRDLNKYIRFMNIFNKKAEKKLLIALEEVNNDNLQNAEEILYKSISKFDKYTSTEIKVLSIKELSKIYIKQDKKYEAINLIKNNINKLTSSEFKKNLDDILNFIKEEIVPIDINLAIEIFEDNADKYEKLNNKQILRLLKAERYVYLLNNNYAKASEVTIKSIYIANKLNYKDEQIESMIDLAVIFKKIKGDQIAVSILEDTFNINTDDKNKLSKLRVRAILNLSDLYLDKEEYKKADEYLNKIYAYKDYYSEEDFRDIEILINNMKAEISIYNNDLNEAKKYLDLSLELQNIDKESYYDKKEVLYKMVLALLYEKEERYEDAKQLYSSLLLVTEKDYYLYEKVMKRLINIEEDNNLKNKYIEDLLLLIDYEQDKRYGDYTYNILDKIKYEIQIEKIYNQRLLIYRIILSVSIIILMFNKKIIKLIKKNNYDVLIPAYNRRYFNKVYKGLIKKKREFFIIMIDIDNFKIINDNYGHKFGDTVLIDVTRLIQSKLSSECKLFRYGGEELAIICRKLTKNRVIEICDEIRNSIQSMNWKYDIITTVSIGVASSLKNSDPLEEADRKLYISKKTGKNRVTY